MKTSSHEGVFTLEPPSSQPWWCGSWVLVLFLHERLAISCAVLAVATLGVVTVLIGLRLTGSELDLCSLMGLTMVAGIPSDGAEPRPCFCAQ